MLYAFRRIRSLYEFALHCPARCALLPTPSDLASLGHLPLHAIRGGGGLVLPHDARPHVQSYAQRGSPYSLAPRPAWFTKNSVYFLCKLCYTVISVYRTGQFRANQKKKYANVYAGREAIYQTIQGQRGWGWPLGIFAHFLRKRTVLKGVYE